MESDAERREVIGVEHVWAGYDHEQVLEDVNLSVFEGDFVGLIGPNGGGKTTLLRVLLGLLPPTRGEVRVMGLPVREGRQAIGYVPQVIAFDREFPASVWDVARMGRVGHRGLLRRYTSADDEIAAEALRQVGLLDLRRRPMGELSGGQRQRVFVAQGFAQEAELLLLDEPVTGLDLVSTEHIRMAVAEELERGATVVMTTHDVADANRAGHVLLMAGRVHAEGPPSRALHPDRLSEAYGIGIVHLEDGSLVLDDAHHRPAAERHVHFGRGR